MLVLVWTYLIASIVISERESHGSKKGGSRSRKKVGSKAVMLRSSVDIHTLLLCKWSDYELPELQTPNICP